MKRDTASGTLRTYVTGFAVSAALTLLAFALVKIHLNHHHAYPSDNFMMAALLFLAVIQLFVQLVFFLHLGRESRPRWNLTVLSFAFIVVAILVGGTIWIMTSLNYHHPQMSPAQTTQYIINDEGIHH